MDPPKITAEDESIALAVHDPFDPTKMPMYAKHLVYRDNTEFSFEEIRAHKWRKVQEERNLSLKRDEINKALKEAMEQKEKIERQSNLLEKKEEEFNLRKVQEEKNLAMKQNEVDNSLKEALAQKEQLENQRKLLEKKEEEIKKEQENLKLMQAMEQKERIERQSNLLEKKEEEFNLRKDQEEKNLVMKQDEVNNSFKEALAQKELLETKRKLLEKKEEEIIKEQENLKLMHQLAIRQQKEEFEEQKNEINRKKLELYELHAQVERKCNELIKYENKQPVQMHHTMPNAVVKNSIGIQGAEFSNYLAEHSVTPMISIEDSASNFYTSSLAVTQDQTTESGDFTSQNSSKPNAPFSIYQDPTTERGDLISQNGSKPNAPFTIYQDQTTERSFSISKNGNKPNAPFTIYEDPEKSNMQEAASYASTQNENSLGKKPRSSRPISDLQYSGDNPRNKHIPLQCRVMDISKPSDASMLSTTNQTMVLPSAESFMEMKSFMKVISTPNSGRRFIPDEDENTCAVQIAYRKPSSSENVTESKDIEDTEKDGQIRKTSRPITPLYKFEETPISKEKLEPVKVNDNVPSEKSDQSRGTCSPFAPSVAIPSLENKLEPIKFDDNAYAADEGCITENTTEIKPEEQLPEKENSFSRYKTTVQQITNMAMSPILETSREYNYRSSSSSHSPWQSSGKSQWNGCNTGGFQHSQRHITSGTSLTTKTPGNFTKSKNLGQIPEEMTCSSGYIADASSARTPGIFLQSDTKTQKTPLTSNCINFNGSQNDEESSEPTEVMNLMKQFQKEAGLLPDSSKKHFKNQLLNAGTHDNSMQCNSFDVSKLATYQPTPSRIETPCARSMFGTPLVIKGDISTLDASLAPPPLLSASAINLEGPDLELTQATPENEPKINASLNLTDQQILCSYQYINNPFDTSIQRKLLSNIEQPVSKRHGYYLLNTNLPNIRSNSIASVGPTIFSIKECKGEGAYGKVFRASRPHEDVNPNETIAEMDSVLKVQKSQPNEWEFYICTELHERLCSQDTQWFMSIPRCYVFNNGNIFVSEHQPFTLLNVCNKLSSLGDCHARELIAVYFTIEMLHMLEKLQKAKIIHADIKPENLMLQHIPRLDENAICLDELFKHITPALILIDFGISIDMELLVPPYNQFYFKCEKEENRIPEMLENKPWNYQIDYIGVAKVAYMMLYGNYMKLSKADGRYETTGKPKRYWNTNLWNQFFKEFLNITSCNSLPDVVETRRSFESFLISKYRGRFHSTFFELSNLLYRR